MTAGVIVSIYKTGDSKYPQLVEKREVDVEMFDDPLGYEDFDEWFSRQMYYGELELEKELDKEFGDSYCYGFLWK